MAQRIFKLSETVINQIAAGEVVENPASIVKELLENSIDAGARQITVAIESGGQRLIQIVDDGCGMGREDALLSVERHATSKIRSADELSQLTTLGFRGEALAAVASISHFEMKTASEVETTRLVIEGGRTVSIEPCARNRGTTISIRSLFFNVPARKKFQKSAAANASQVKRIVESIALTYPEIGFSLTSEGKKVLEVFPEKNWKRRVEEILGPFEHEIQFKSDAARVWGVTAAPDQAMATRSGQYLFVNRRFVFSPLVSRAAKEGFSTRIDTASHPPFVLFIEIEPDQIDVNVHPQKKEIRFRNEGAVFRAVLEAVQSGFSSFESSPEPIFPSPFSFREEPNTFPWESAAPFPVFAPRREEQPSLSLAYIEKPIAVWGSFFLLQKEKLLLIDLKAARARILFEALSSEKGASQSLLFPLEIEWKEGEEEVAELNRMGIECRLLGGKKLAVDALPLFLDSSDFPQFLFSWKEKKEIGFAASRFCRALKKSYLLEEAHLLWKELQKCSDRSYDPLGKPIWKEVEEADFELVMSKKNG